jgi:methionyl aminopeptidase
MYSEEQIANWRKAGKMAREVLLYGKSLIKNDASYLEVSNKIDQKIYDLGGSPAWPCQVSFDQIAAHQCADPDDERVFDNNVVKLDVGVQVEGCIGDNALTVDLSGKYSDIVKAAEEALKAAEKTLAIGTTLNDIGTAVQETIESYGLKPVKNLSGHTIEPYIIHAQPSIPSFATGEKTALVDGQVIAIEPFATNGHGFIYEADHANLFALVNNKPVRSPFAREILKFARENYGVFPFTTRWLSKQFGLGKTKLGLRELHRMGNIIQHPPLIERGKGMVAQFENTFMIGDKVERLTKI